MRTLFALVLMSSLSFAAVEDTAAQSTSELKIPTHRFSPLYAGIDLQYVPVQYSEFQWASGDTNVPPGKGVRIGIQWIPFGATVIGKIAVGIAAGYQATSPVYLPNGAGTRPGQGSLIAIPIEVEASYRLDIHPRQPIVPFVGIGRSYSFFRQTIQSGTGANKKVENYDTAFEAVEYKGGVEINLGSIDWNTAKTFDSGMGINGTYLVVEYLNIQGMFTRSVELSRNEWRLGLRFEL